MEQTDKMFAHHEAVVPAGEPSEKGHTLEEYSYDHFRLVSYLRCFPLIYMLLLAPFGIW